jgi:hypothetical protein
MARHTTTNASVTPVTMTPVESAEFDADASLTGSGGRQ